MRYRKLAANNDYSFGNGQRDFFRDEPAAVGQSVQTRLLLFLGEWYLNVNDGTPYIEGVLGKHSLAQADVIIQQRALASTDGAGVSTVTDISSYVSSLDPDTRAMQAQFSIDTIYGPTQVQIENYANF